MDSVDVAGVAVVAGVVGDPAVLDVLADFDAEVAQPAAGWRPAPTGIDHEIGVFLGDVIEPDTSDSNSGRTLTRFDMEESGHARRAADLDAWVGGRRQAEGELERRPARQEPRELVVFGTVELGRGEELEEVDLLDPVVAEAVEDSGRVAREQVARTGGEGVRLSELGHVRPVPFLERLVAVGCRRGSITLDHEHVVATIGEPDRGAEAAHSRSDHHDPGHAIPLQQ